MIENGRTSLFFAIMSCRENVCVCVWWAYVFRVHILDGNDSRWTIRCYFPRVVNCQVAFTTRRFSRLSPSREKIRRGARSVKFRNFETTAKNLFTVLESQMAKGWRDNENSFLEKRRFLARERAAIDNRQVEKSTQIGGRGRRNQRGRQWKIAEKWKRDENKSDDRYTLSSKSFYPPAFIHSGECFMEIASAADASALCVRDAPAWICIVTLFREEKRPVSRSL